MHYKLVGTTVSKSAVVGFLLHKDDQADFYRNQLFSSSALKLQNNHFGHITQLVNSKKEDSTFHTSGTKIKIQ